MLPGSTAAFWLTLPIDRSCASGVHNATLVLLPSFSVELQVLVRDFTLPDSAHASQWTEADPFGVLEACNTAGPPRPPHCPTNTTDFPHNEHPCKTAAVVDAYYAQMANSRINRAVWMYDFDFAAGVGLKIAADTQSVWLDTKDFDANFENLIRLGYRDIRFPVPACLSGSSCGLIGGAGISPNHTWVFGNSTGWYGGCSGHPPYSFNAVQTCVNGFPPQTLVVPIFQNASLNAPSRTNASLAVWQTQRVGDTVELNPEFVRLFRLVMEPMAKHMRAKGWINRTWAYISDEPKWPIYKAAGGSNFTTNAYIAFANLYRSLDPAIRVQQDLTPAADSPTWKALLPVVDAWVWWQPKLSSLPMIADARRAGKSAYMYNNEIMIVDLPGHRLRTFPWQLWRTNYAYNVSRHLGLQGSLSWYSITGYFGSDPWKYANVACDKPSGSAHPTHPGPDQPQCEVERGAGEWYTLYPPPDGDICHKGAVTSIRWELLRQGLEDVEYMAMLDRLAGEADRRYDCGYEAAVLRGRGHSLRGNESVPPLSGCCAALDGAKSALDHVDLVTWGLTSSIMTGKPIYNQTVDEPYTLDPAVLHRVIDDIADAIELVQGSCSGSSQPR